MRKFSDILREKYISVASAILLIGVGSGFISFFLHKLVKNISSLSGTSKPFTPETFLYSLLFAFSSYFFTKYFFPDTNGSGIPQVKISLVAFKGRMPRRMPFGKFITSILTLCSGLSFGKEGPMVTISASFGHLIARIFGFSRRLTKVMVTSGATAGLAAAFNTPIAAVVFTIEEIMGELNTKYLGPIIITSVIASFTSYKLSGGQTTFITVTHKFTHDWHLILYFLLGCLTSIIGSLFIKSIVTIKGLKKKFFKEFNLLFILFIVCILGVFSLYSPNVLGDGIETINLLLKGNQNFNLGPLLLLLLLKFILTTSSYSTGLSGGIFMPVLFLGALIGAIIGILLSNLGLQNIEVGIFSLLGMTSLLVAVVRAPFTAFIMLFELTRDYELILPLMISTVGAYWISDLLNKESVYESVAEYEGVHLPNASEKECLSDMTVEEAMKEDVTFFLDNMTYENAFNLVKDKPFGGYPILKNDKLIGVINRRSLKENYEKNPHAYIGSYERLSLITIYPDQSLLIAMDKMKRFEIGRLPVVSRINDKKVLGIITPEDIINFLGISKSIENR